MPDMTLLPDPSPLTSQPRHPSSSTVIRPQSSPLTEIADLTTDATTSTSTGLLESKHIFGIIVGGLLLIILIIIGVVVIGFLLILTARRRKRHQFVETFIETTDNEAYTIRRKVPYTRSQNGHIAQKNLQKALISQSDDLYSTIATTTNVAYSTSTETSKIGGSHQANHIPVSTFTIGTRTRNGNLNHSSNRHPNQGTIAMERNVAYLTNSETPVVGGSHQAGAIPDAISSPVAGTDKGGMNHRTIEMKANEAYHTKESTLEHRGLPDGRETLVKMSLMHERRSSLSSSSSLDNGSGRGQSNRGQSPHREQTAV